MQAITVLLLLGLVLAGRGEDYPWLSPPRSGGPRVLHVGPPKGFARVKVAPESFAHWLRHLPVDTKSQRVKLYNGKPKANQRAHYRILDLDTGERDLQQCADAVMRLRAEFLFARKRFDEIQFHFTSGDLARYTDWRQGIRPHVRGNRVQWKKTTKADASYSGFRKYLASVFTYAGTASLEKEMSTSTATTPAGLPAVSPGDVFIQGGFPGHAVIVVDVVEDEKGKQCFLLAQSFMPAQQMHLLRNPEDPRRGPWHQLKAGQPLRTAEWTFQSTAPGQF